MRTNGTPTTTSRDGSPTSTESPHEHGSNRSHHRNRLHRGSCRGGGRLGGQALGKRGGRGEAVHSRDAQRLLAEAAGPTHEARRADRRPRAPGGPARDRNLRGETHGSDAATNPDHPVPCWRGFAGWQRRARGDADVGAHRNRDVRGGDGPDAQPGPSPGEEAVKRAALFAAWCLVFWLYGCATIQPVLDQFQPKPGQDEAVRIVWVDVMGRPDKPPAVRWIEGDALNRTTSSGGPGFLTPLQACVQGFTVSLWHVDVAAWPGMLFSESALPHEFL